MMNRSPLHSGPTSVLAVSLIIGGFGVVLTSQASEQPLTMRSTKTSNHDVINLSNDIAVLYEDEGLRVERTTEDEEVLRFLYFDNEIWRTEAAHIKFGGSFIMDDDQPALLAPGLDLDMNGFPDFLVETSTGGRMGGYEYTWLEWHKPELVVRDHLSTGAAAFHTALDITGDGCPELWIRDTQFLYWRVSRAASVAKDVIIVLDDDGFRIAHELMVAAALREEELAQMATELRAEMVQMASDKLKTKENQHLADLLRYRYTFKTLAAAKDKAGLLDHVLNNPYHAAQTVTDDEIGMPRIELPPPRLWDIMLDLVYTGHKERADLFLDQAWPLHIHGKDEFRTDFWETLELGLFHQRSK